MTDQCLIIFARYPEPHKCKTRLIPVLGAEGAAELQGEMAEHTLAWAAQLAARRAVCVEVCFEGGDELRMQQRFGRRFPYSRQSDGDLGQRMAAAFAAAFQAGSARVVLVGTDCPGLNPDLAETALDRLFDNDLVLGPATDGGYYLIGLRRPCADLFVGIPWSTDKVLLSTLAAAQRAGLSVSLLPSLTDVDRPEDLTAWTGRRNRGPDCHGQPRISIIIPTLNEAGCLGLTLQSLQRASGVETIVVDADSRDGTVRIAEAQGCRVLTAPQGRARQMNAGAALVTSPILLFLHADTRLPEHFDRQVRQTLAQPGVIAGAFRLRIDASGWSFRLIQRMANLRSRYFQMPYGDQAIFMHAATFRRIGGYPEIPIMEDYEIVRRLHRLGRIAAVSADAVTSPRRWQTFGPWRTTWVNQKVIYGYHMGISPERLARWRLPREDR